MGEWAAVGQGMQGEIRASNQESRDNCTHVDLFLPHVTVVLLLPSTAAAQAPCHGYSSLVLDAFSLPAEVHSEVGPRIPGFRPVPACL